MHVTEFTGFPYETTFLLAALKFYSLSLCKNTFLGKDTTQRKYSPLYKKDTKENQNKPMETAKVNFNYFLWFSKYDDTGLRKNVNLKCKSENIQLFSITNIVNFFMLKHSNSIKTGMSLKFY